jgi:methionyl-tRNA synthetase
MKTFALFKTLARSTSYFLKSFQTPEKSLIRTFSTNPIQEISLKRLHQRSPRPPSDTEKSILITSALPYVNNVPHLGNIIGCVLSADVYSRFCRLMNYNSIYICGTDEYGTATETKALLEKTTPSAICDKFHKLHKEIYDWFDIDFDIFGRTTTSKQTEIASDIFLKLHANGELQEKEVEQCFCPSCSKFLADRFVNGTCPACHSPEARGDQCDRCGKILNPEELLKPKCFVCASPAETRTSRHVFLDLPNIKERLVEWVEKSVRKGNWSHNCVKTTEAWIKEGIRPRCITRDLKWGTPVPLEGFQDKVFYVWFDAPIGYISITANLTDNWQLWWKNPKNVELVQFMGKDNITFHTVMFPSTLIGTGENWTLLKTISSTEYLKYEDGKFSKSRGVGVFGDQVMTTGIPVEVFRYYLLSNRPEIADSSFKWTDLALKSNNELLPNLGNLLNRLLKFLEKRKIVVKKSEASHSDIKILEVVFILVKTYIEEMEQIRLKNALKTAMEISMIGNKFLQDSQFWNLEKTDPKRLESFIWVAVNLIRLVTLLLEPFMPSFSEKVYKQLGIERTEREEKLLAEVAEGKNFSVLLDLVKTGLVVRDVQPIFKSIKQEEVEELIRRFAGKQ